MRITNTRLMFVPIAVAALLTFGVTDANAGKASKKTAAAGSTLERVPESGGTVILDEYIKTSKYTDLILQVTSECSLITSATTTGDDTSATEARLRVWVEIDGIPVYVEDDDGSYITPQNGDTDYENENQYKVVFCSRLHQQTTENFNDLEEYCELGGSLPFLGGLSDCDDLPAPVIETFHQTRQANAFNWMALNVGKDPYIHHVQVFADLETRMDGDSVPANDEIVWGAIGNRTLIIEPVKASKREGISELSAEDGDSDGYWD